MADFNSVFSKLYNSKPNLKVRTKTRGGKYATSMGPKNAVEYYNELVIPLLAEIGPESMEIIRGGVNAVGEYLESKILENLSRDFPEASGYDKLMLVKEVNREFSSEDDMFCVNIETNRYVPIRPKTFLHYAKKSQLEYPETEGTRFYSPLAPNVRETDVADFKMIKEFNTYIPPKYRIFPASDSYDKNFEKLNALLLNLFNGPGDLEYAYAWMAKSLTDGPGKTIMVLTERNGNSGKSAFKAIMAALHGYSNSSDLKSSSFDRFNSVFSKSTFTFYEEGIITEEIYNELKKYTNKTVAIEAKNADATTNEVFSSIVIANNAPDKASIPFSARKLFVPLSGRRKPIDIFMEKWGIDSREYLTAFDSSVKAPDLPTNPEYVKAVYDYVLQRGKPDKYPDDMLFRGGAFYQVANENMPRWLSRLVNCLIAFGVASDGTHLNSAAARMGVTSEIDKKAVNKNTLKIGQPFYWSEFLSLLNRKFTERTEFPKNSKVQQALYDYRNKQGEKIFEVSSDLTDDSLNDFKITLLPIIQKNASNEELRAEDLL